ncbi:WXG100 family type VII secretion target [Mycobacteroides abscessus subsp. massiliense]|uniref:hypothetical protein n=1 Tax=Mycobacteroides abscessus TaxID=36809 RepID=UPI0009A8281A|nr:hypothetical protein [Mycobacteroides abscessus]SKK91708.1 WXG100 family type VII secretion target [Mycobacteroides abscessus subsp. massiliense]
MFQTDTDTMLTSAGHLDNIRNEIMGMLNQYMTTNQDLTSGAFTGIAATQSTLTAEDILNTGRQVSDRFQGVIDHMKSSAHQYAAMNQDNAVKLGHVGA